MQPSPLFPSTLEGPHRKVLLERVAVDLPVAVGVVDLQIERSGGKVGLKRQRCRDGGQGSLNECTRHCRCRDVHTRPVPFRPAPRRGLGTLGLSLLDHRQKRVRRKGEGMPVLPPSWSPARRPRTRLSLRSPPPPPPPSADPPAPKRVARAVLGRAPRSQPAVAGGGEQPRGSAAGSHPEVAYVVRGDADARRLKIAGKVQTKNDRERVESVRGGFGRKVCGLGRGGARLGNAERDRCLVRDHGNLAGTAGRDGAIRRSCGLAGCKRKHDRKKDCAHNVQKLRGCARVAMRRERTPQNNRGKQDAGDAHPRPLDAWNARKTPQRRVGDRFEATVPAGS